MSPLSTRFRPAPVVLAALAVLLVAAGLVAVAVRSGDGQAEVASRGPEGQARAEPQAEGAPAEPSVESPPTTAGATVTTQRPTTSESLPHVPPAQRPPLKELMAQTAAVRGLAWKEPLNLRIVARDEMVRRLRAANERDADPAQVAAEEATLKLLGLIPANLDYRRLLDDLNRGVVLGFYDPETKELYVGVGNVNALNATEKATIVHEMVHALTDQHFAYGPHSIQLDKADKAEEYLALISLLEGDARLTETLWMDRYLSEIEVLGVLFGVGVDTGDGVDVLSRTPTYIRNSLFFPYEEGLEFVEGLHSAGGFAAVNAAYRRPPTSTEHVLHPETYRAGQGSAPPALPDVAASTGCSRVRTGTLGEFDMRALLETNGGGDAARGWNGDAYQVVRCGGVLAMADRWQTDAGVDAGGLAEALGRWARTWSGGQGPGPDGTFSGPSGAGRIVRSGNRIDLVVARDAPTAQRVAAALG